MLKQAQFRASTKRHAVRVDLLGGLFCLLFSSIVSYAHKFELYIMSWIAFISYHAWEPT